MTADRQNGRRSSAIGQKNDIINQDCGLGTIFAGLLKYKYLDFKTVPGNRI